MFEEQGVTMIHRLRDEDREEEERTGEKQRLRESMVTNKSGFDILYMQVGDDRSSF